MDMLHLYILYVSYQYLNNTYQSDVVKDWMQISRREETWLCDISVTPSDQCFRSQHISWFISVTVRTFSSCSCGNKTRDFKLIHCHLQKLTIPKLLLAVGLPEHHRLQKQRHLHHNWVHIPRFPSINISPKSAVWSPNDHHIGTQWHSEPHPSQPEPHQFAFRSHRSMKIVNYCYNLCSKLNKCHVFAKRLKERAGHDRGKWCILSYLIITN